MEVPWDFGYCTALTCDGGTANVLWMCYACANRLPMMCYRDIYMDSGSVEKPNLPECASRTRTHQWGSIRMPLVCDGSAADPLRPCCGHNAMDVLRTKMDEICSYYGYLRDGCAIHVPWAVSGYCMALTCNVGAANVSWMCYAYANHLPIICYGVEYMDPGLRGETKFAGMRIADANVPLGICNPNAAGPLRVRCRSTAAMLRACYGCAAREN